MTQATDGGQITITDNQRQLPMDGLLVEDGILMIQIVERLSSTGVVKGAELYPLGMLRERIVAAIGRTTSLDAAVDADAAADVVEKKKAKETA